MKKNETFERFGCTWLVDDIYTVPESELMSDSNPFGLVYPVRYKAHVISAPEGYEGATEIDAALTA